VEHLDRIQDAVRELVPVPRISTWGEYEGWKVLVEIEIASHDLYRWRRVVLGGY
jgi:hypothetical protein